MEIFASFIEYVRSQQVMESYVQTALKEFDQMTFVSDKCMISDFLFYHKPSNKFKKYIMDTFYRLRHPLNEQIGDHWKKYLNYKPINKSSALNDILKDIETNEKKLIPYSYFVSAVLDTLNQKEEEFFNLKNIKTEPEEIMET